MDNEQQRIGLALQSLADLCRLRTVSIQYLGTAGVRVFVEPSDTMPSSDVTEFTLIESLEKTLKEIRGY